MTTLSQRKGFGLTGEITDVFYNLQLLDYINNENLASTYGFWIFSQISYKLLTFLFIELIIIHVHL